MGSSQGWFESDEDYRSRMAKESDEYTIEQSTGEKPSQGWFESDESYRDRISTKANESRIESSTGSVPSQGWFESDDSYRERIHKEANERTVKDSTGSAPSQGWFESDEHYDIRIRKEANESIIRDGSNKAPKQGCFEGDHEYRSRIAHEARQARAENLSKNKSNSGVNTSYSSSQTSGGIGIIIFVFVSIIIVVSILSNLRDNTNSKEINDFKSAFNKIRFSKKHVHVDMNADSTNLSGPGLDYCLKYGWNYEYNNDLEYAREQGCSALFSFKYGSDKTAYVVLGPGKYDKSEIKMLIFNRNNKYITNTIIADYWSDEGVHNNWDSWIIDLNSDGYFDIVTRYTNEQYDVYSDGGLISLQKEYASEIWHKNHFVRNDLTESDVNKLRLW